MPTKASKRVEWIDILKGLGIVLVVMGHTPAFAEPYWVYSFHMPLFFFVVGLLFPEKSKTNLPVFLKKRAIRRLAPYLIYSVIAVALSDLIFRHFARTDHDPVSLASYETGLFTGFPRADVVLWFYPVLFGAETIVALIVRLAAPKFIKASAFVALIIAACFTSPPQIRYVQFGNTCVMSAIFIFAGIYARDILDTLRNCPSAWKALVFIMALLTSIWLATVQVRAMHGRSDLSTARYGNVGVYIICACAGILVCCCLSFEFEKLGFGFLASIGGATGVIFPLHQPLHPFITAFIVFVLRQPNTVQDHAWGWGVFYILIMFWFSGNVLFGLRG